MNIKQKVKIHNRFDFEVRDINTGEISYPGAYAENILLDVIYTRLCAGSSFFTNIHFGTGTGTLSAARTSLFTHLGTKTATNEEVVRELPTSSWKQKIVLDPEEYVGSTITEVGIARGSTESYLMTHAFIKDAEGNQISIVKTDTSVVTIYATVYITFDTSTSGLAWIGFPDNNILANYLTTNSYSSGQRLELLELPRGATPNGYTSDVSWTADSANKQRKCDEKRFGIDDANGNALAMRLEDIFELSFPMTDVHEGRTYTDVPLGVGDGAEDTFDLPSKNLKSGTLTVKVDGTETSAYSLENITAYGAIVPPEKDYVSMVRVTSNGNVFMALKAQYGVSNRVSVFDLVDGEWVERTEASGQSSTISVMDISDDGNTFVIGNSSAVLQVYDWNSTTKVWTERPTVTNILSNMLASLLNTDGTILITAGYTSPFMRVYDFNKTTNTWAERAVPSGLSALYTSMAMNADGSVIAIFIDSSSSIKIYDWNSGTNEWISRVTLSLGSNISRLNISEDGIVFACKTSSGQPKVFDWNSTTETWSARTAFPVSSVAGCLLSPDGQILATQQTTSPYVQVYEYDNSEWVVKPDLINLDSAPSDMAMNLDGSKLFMGLTLATNSIKEYTNSAITEHKIKFTTAPAQDEVLTATYTVKGVHKTTNQVIDVSFAIQFGESV